MKSAALESLSVHGNPLESHPDHKSWLVRAFPRLTSLDGEPITGETRNLLLEAQRLGIRILPFFARSRLSRARLDSIVRIMQVRDAHYRKLDEKGAGKEGGGD